MCANQNNVNTKSDDSIVMNNRNSMNITSQDKSFFNFDEACSYLSFTKNRMSDLIENNKIPYCMFMNSYYFKKRDLDIWFNWILNSIKSCELDWDDDVSNLPDLEMSILNDCKGCFEYGVVNIDNDDKVFSHKNEVVWISTKDKRRLYKWLLKMNDRRHIFVKYNENDFNCLFTDFFDMDSDVVKEYDEHGFFDIF